MAKTPDFQGTALSIAIDAGPTALDRLNAALGAASIVSLIIMPPPGGSLDAAAARPLVERAQERDVAALIYGDAALARALRADGVHVPASAQPLAAYTEAREVLGNRYIVGAHAGKSRHDAMSLGEAGADYVAFGVPADVQDIEGAERRRYELVAWWAEIFQVPCLALDVTSLEAAEDLASAGADFISITLNPAQSPADTADFIAHLAGLVAAINADREAAMREAFKREAAKRDAAKREAKS